MRIGPSPPTSSGATNQESLKLKITAKYLHKGHKVMSADAHQVSTKKGEKRKACGLPTPAWKKEMEIAADDQNDTAIFRTCKQRRTPGQAESTGRLTITAVYRNWRWPRSRAEKVVRCTEPCHWLQTWIAQDVQQRCFCLGLQCHRLNQSVPNFDPL